jgi:hypothetical protein
MAGSTLYILWHDDDFIMKKKEDSAFARHIELVLPPRTHPIRVWSFSMTSHRTFTKQGQARATMLELPG